jgi:hypothetical protein
MKLQVSAMHYAVQYRGKVKICRLEQYASEGSEKLRQSY